MIPQWGSLRETTALAKYSSSLSPTTVRSTTKEMAWAHRPLRLAMWHRAQGTTEFGSRTATAATCSPTRKDRHAAPAAWKPAALTPCSSVRQILAAVRPTRTLEHPTYHHAPPITTDTRVLTPSPFPKEHTASGWRAARCARLQVTSRSPLSDKCRSDQQCIMVNDAK